MLVGNKFIYCSIPRTSTTSFHITCFRNNIDVKHVDTYYDTDSQLKHVPNLSIIKDNYTLSHTLHHTHECIIALEHKFGKNFEVIAVKRNRYERFISSWKHLLHNIQYSRINNYKELVEKLSKLDENELFDFDNEMLTTENVKPFDSTYTISTFFLRKFNVEIPTDKLHFLNKIFWWQFVPASYYHQNYSKVIWFDFEKLYELEEWASNKLNIDFKLQKINSSKDVECKLKLTDNFIKKYNDIYDRFDIVKTKKSFI
jgi:hypothetical protein